MDSYALKNVLKFLSLIGMSVTLFLLLPVLIGILYQEDMTAFLLFDLFLFLINYILYLSLKKHEMKMSIKDGILSVNLVWVLLGIAGAVPLVLYTEVTWAEAFFESISGFTTTEATIYANIEA